MTIDLVTTCPTCKEPILVDWDASRLDERPQLLVTYCPNEHVRYHTRAHDCTDGTFWMGDKAHCRICGHAFHAVFRMGVDRDALPCESCGHPTAEVVHDDDVDDDPLPWT